MSAPPPPDARSGRLTISSYRWRREAVAWGGGRSTSCRSGPRAAFRPPAAGVSECHADPQAPVSHRHKQVTVSAVVSCTFTNPLVATPVSGFILTIQASLCDVSASNVQDRGAFLPLWTRDKYISGLTGCGISSGTLLITDLNRYFTLL